MFQPRKIWVPIALDEDVDSALTTEAVDTAMNLARRYGSEIVLVHAPPFSPPMGAIGVEFTGEIQMAQSSIFDAQCDAARERLTSMYRHFCRPEVRMSTAVLSTPEPVADRICRQAIDDHVDLIVLSSHARRGLQRLFMGSVAERIVRRAEVPVLLLKPLRLQHVADENASTSG